MWKSSGKNVNKMWGRLEKSSIDQNQSEVLANYPQVRTWFNPKKALCRVVKNNYTHTNTTNINNRFYI